MRILYIATSAYPGDNAYATRIYGICKALQLAGNQTDVLTDYSNLGHGSFNYEGSKVTIGAKHSYADRKLSDKILASLRMEKELKRMLRENRYDCVITSSLYMRIKKILKIVHSLHIPVILESCEWFESYNWKNGEKSYEYKRFVKAWNKEFVKADGVIAISRMLETHYRESIDYVIRIPTIMDIPNEYHNMNNNGPIKLIFTGSIAWGKDKLIEAINAIDELRNEHIYIELHIYGPTKSAVVNQINNNIDILNRNPGIIIHGRVPHDVISKKCAECDFGIILRPDRKQSNAGFPTKIAEYFAVGTSVIANETGDLGLYINNGYNGFLLPTDFSVEQLKELLRNISLLKRETLDVIKRNAYETAFAFFNCTKYSQALNSFVKNVISSTHFSK